MRWCSAAVFTAILTSPALQAKLELAPLFQDGAVLQRDKSVPVWGHADPKATISVSFGGQNRETHADDAGRWRVDLAAMPANAEGRTLTVKENGTVTEVKDVLVGEVWLASGQSNMQWAISATRPEDQQAAAAGPVPGLRLFQVPLVLSYQRKDQVNAHWAAATPETAKGFSAIGYFFGRKLAEELKVPVGIIQSAWGGSKIEPWWAEEGLTEIPALAEIAKRRRASSPGFPEYDKPYRSYLGSLRDWTTTAEKAMDAGKLVPDAPKAPALLALGHASETGTYQAMIHPLVPAALRGFIWYQGESNNGDGMIYAEKMKALIAGWRKQFNDPKAPFLYVQLAPYKYSKDQYVAEQGGMLPQIWWAQQSVLSVPGTGMAVINDIGNPANIHPTNKSEVARRLALWALADTYGRKDLVKSGPLFTDYKAEDGRIRVSFAPVGGGLATRDGKAPTWFEIAGPDNVYKVADAEIAPDGKSVLLKSADVPNPIAVRFAWSEIAEPNLMNREGLPAAAFNSHWPVNPEFGLLVSNGKPVTSSNPNSGWNNGLTDGAWGDKAGTCYATANAPAFPKTATIDLGMSYKLKTIRYGVPAIGATKTVAISISEDGRNFTEVTRHEFAPKTAAGETAKFPPRPARYVRATFLDHHDKQDDFDPNFGFLSEVEAYAVPTP